MKNNLRFSKPGFLLVFLFLSVSLACNLPLTGSTSTRTPDETNDSITTRTPSQPPGQTSTFTSTTAPSATPNPTSTPVPTITSVPPTFTPTLTSIPCNWAQFISDVTIPDDTEITANTAFTKTWRLKNIGSCTWTSGYQLIFDHGDRMNAPDSVALTGASISPGSTIDTSVKLTAPNDEGTYQGFFKIRSPEGIVFGIGNSANNSFFVKIISKPVAVLEVPPLEVPPLVLLRADLKVTDITLIPNPPVKGQAVTVKVSVYNQGNAASGPYRVNWWPGESYPNPACTWLVDNSNSKGGRVLTCNYAGYPSAYGSINTKAVVDSNGQVDESDEGNNTLLKNISVKNP